MQKVDLEQNQKKDQLENKVYLVEISTERIKTF